MSEERLASSGCKARKEKSITVKAANVTDSISGISYFIKETLAAMMPPVRDDGKRYCCDDVVSGWQDVVGKI